MATDMSDTSPIGCQLGAFDLEESERYKSLRDGMRSTIQEMKELQDNSGTPVLQLFQLCPRS